MLTLQQCSAYLQKVKSGNTFTKETDLELATLTYLGYDPEQVKLTTSGNGFIYGEGQSYPYSKGMQRLLHSLSYYHGFTVDFAYTVANSLLTSGDE